MPRNLLLKKKIDWSVLEHGIHIPIEYHRNFFVANGEYLPRGQSRQIDLVWNGQTIKTRLYNINREVQSDTLQIKYGKGTPASDFLKAIFQKTYINVIKQREIGHKKGKVRPQTKIPDGEAEYLYIYSTNIPYVYEIECETQVQGFYYEFSTRGESKIKETKARFSLEQENSLLTEASG